MKKLLPLIAALALFAATPAPAAIVTKDITYKDGDVELTGHYAYDDAIKTPVPGIIVVHEWWGNNDYSRHRAEQLAGNVSTMDEALAYARKIIADVL